jgi:heme-degrading monooxygenase HmoA
MKEDFIESFQQAGAIINKVKGYISHSLQQCLEEDHRFLLTVKWETLEDHVIGFRKSAEYENWKALLHHFYHPFPVVEHFTSIMAGEKQGN